MNCPICKNGCYDNRTNKKNPNGPDFKCKSCGSAGWLDRKDANKVNFQSADKTTKMSATLDNSVPAPSAPRPAYTKQAAPSVNVQAPSAPDKEVILKSMYTAWAKDLTVAAVANGVTVDEMFAKFAQMHAKVGAFLNASTPVAQVAAAAPVAAVESHGTEEEVDFTDLGSVLEGL
jgi:cytoskeletal protein RodZ